jgi:hypothetical protein
VVGDLLGDLLVLPRARPATPATSSGCRSAASTCAVSPACITSTCSTTPEIYRQIRGWLAERPAAEPAGTK